jgi:hypothetical protein
MSRHRQQAVFLASVQLADHLERSQIADCVGRIDNLVIHFGTSFRTSSAGVPSRLTDAAQRACVSKISPPPPFTLQEQAPKQRTEVFSSQGWRYRVSVRSAVIFFTHRGQYSDAVALAGWSIFDRRQQRISTLSIRRRVRTVWSEGIFRRG